MSVIIVQVGQCGNQVGDALWRELLAGRQKAGSGIAAPRLGGRPTVGAGAAKGNAQLDLRYGPLFASDGFARCVLVDGEPKVVQTVAAAAPTLYRKGNLVYGQSGRGNCWTDGYCAAMAVPSQSTPRRRQKFSVGEKDQRSADDSLLHRALRAIHEEMHRAEDGGIEAVVVLHSLAGGTGSGLGTAIVENLRQHFIEERETDDGTRDAPVRGAACVSADSFLEGAYRDPRKARYLVACPVVPRVHGDTTVQSYNVALALQVLLAQTDATLLLRNDVSGITDATWTLDAVNAHFAACLAAVLRYGKLYGAVADIVTHCAPLRGLSLLSPVIMGTKRGAASAHAFHGCAVNARLYTTQTELTVEAVQPFLAKGATGASMAAITTAAAATATSKELSVALLNQAAELTRTLLWPLLRDAAVKLQSKAFLHAFHARGKAVAVLKARASQLPRAVLDEASPERPEDVVGALIRVAISDVARALLRYPNVERS